MGWRCLRRACREESWVLHSRGVLRRPFKWRGNMNRRIGFLTAVLAVAGILNVRGAVSQPTPQATRKMIKLAGGTITAPFSDAILAGKTLPLAGRIGM